MKIGRLWVTMVVLLVGACTATPAASGIAPTPSLPAVSAPAPSPTEVTSSAPVGIIAIGHSGLTGEGTGGQYEPMPENSWATGTNPDVNSVYLRMTAILPDTQGHVANTASGGASASELLGQAAAALAQVPHPVLVIVSTIDDDIKCDGHDDEHIAAFGQAVGAALQSITAASPGSKILMVGQAGRPTIAFINLLIAANPGVRSNLSGIGPCDFFDPTGKLVPAHFVELTRIINAFEAEQARVCATFPQCRTDGGVRAAYVDVLENFGPDLNHLNVRGQAAEAALIWPVVEGMLKT